MFLLVCFLVVRMFKIGIFALKLDFNIRMSDKFQVNLKIPV